MCERTAARLEWVMAESIDYQEAKTMQNRILIGGMPLGWPERILAGVLAVLLVLLGLAFGVVILGLGVVAGLGLAARIWWLRRQLRRQGAGSSASSVVVEGEYQVLERRSVQGRRDPED